MNKGGSGKATIDKIYCYTLKGNLYGIYDSFIEASKATNVNYTLIKSAIYNPKALTGGGFQWYFENNINQIKDLSNLSQNYGKIDVLTLQYDLEGNYLNQYSTMLEAEKNTGVLSSGIARCINNQQLHAGGFQWKRGFKGEPFDLKINPILLSKKQITQGKAKKILCIKKNKTIIYNSLSEASKQEKLSRTTISRYCQKYPKLAPNGNKYKYYE